MISDIDLITRVLARDDRHAFATLVRRYQSQVRTLLRRLCAGDKALADDLAQEVFLRAYRGLAGYRGGAKFSAWIYRIAYHAFLNDKRRQRHREQPMGEATHTATTAEAAMVCDTSVAPGGLRRDIDQAMTYLSEHERAVMALAYGMEATHEDIAGILEFPLGTVKTHISRAKDKLRRRLHAWRPA